MRLLPREEVSPPMNITELVADVAADRQAIKAEMDAAIHKEAVRRMSDGGITGPLLAILTPMLFSAVLLGPALASASGGRALTLLALIVGPSVAMFSAYWLLRRSMIRRSEQVLTDNLVYLTGKLPDVAPAVLFDLVVRLSGNFVACGEQATALDRVIRLLNGDPAVLAVALTQADRFGGLPSLAAEMQRAKQAGADIKELVAALPGLDRVSLRLITSRLPRT